MSKHNEVGRWGEIIATEYLASKGYSIVDHNWHLRPYELDIIAMKGIRLVFVEVKTRSRDDEDPFDAITPSKIRRTIAAGVAYANTYNLVYPVQFDVIGITGTPDNYTIDHIEDAFPIPTKRYR